MAMSIYTALHLHVLLSWSVVVCVFVCVRAGGYINISYAMLLPLFLSTMDLISDVLFVWRLSNSHWRIGRTFLYAAMAVLASSILGNFLAFFGIFIYSYRRGKVSFKGVCGRVLLLRIIICDLI